ncbi:hypothetical protein ACFL2R_03145 [Patescibacteria group bacterium]
MEQSDVMKLEKTGREGDDILSQISMLQAEQKRLADNADTPEKRAELNILGARLNGLMKDEEGLRVSFAEQSMALVRSAKDLGVEVVEYEKYTPQEEAQLKKLSDAIVEAKKAVQKIEDDKLNWFQLKLNGGRDKMLKEANDKLEAAKTAKENSEQNIQKSISDRLEEASLEANSQSLLNTGNRTIVRIGDKITVIDGHIETLSKREKALQVEIQSKTEELSRLRVEVEKKQQEVDDKQQEMLRFDIGSPVYETENGKLRILQEELEKKVNERDEVLNTLNTTKEMQKGAQSHVTAQRKFLRNLQILKSALEISMKELIPQVESRLELARILKMQQFTGELMNLGSDMALDFSKYAAKAGHASDVQLTEWTEEAPKRDQSMKDVLDKQGEATRQIMGRLEDILKEFDSGFAE